MVKNFVWKEAGLESNDIVCLKCLERKLKRELIVDDFPKYKINELFWKGVKLGIKLERSLWKTK